MSYNRDSDLTGRLQLFLTTQPSLHLCTHFLAAHPCWSLSAHAHIDSFMTRDVHGMESQEMCCGGAGRLSVQLGADLLKDKCGTRIGFGGKAEFLRWGRWLKVRVSMPLSYGCPLRLSSISSGCINAIEPHLPTSISYLINVLNDSNMNCIGPFILYYFWVALIASCVINNMLDTRGDTS